MQISKLLQLGGCQWLLVGQWQRRVAHYIRRILTQFLKKRVELCSQDCPHSRSGQAHLAYLDFTLYLNQIGCG